MWALSGTPSCTHWTISSPQRQPWLVLSHKQALRTHWHSCRGHGSAQNPSIAHSHTRPESIRTPGHSHIPEFGPSTSYAGPLKTVSMLAAAAMAVLIPGSAAAAGLHAEPGNALSLPTWTIHISSVLEWITAMGLFWRYAEVTGASSRKFMLLDH